MFKMLVLAILALVALRGLYLLNNAIRGVRQADASTGWPKTQGVVVRTDDSRHDTVYNTRATVQYKAGDGKEYSTDRISFGETLNPFDRQVAGLQRIRYPDGSKVSVSYDPGDPATAILQPGRHADAFWPIGVSLAYLLPVALCLMQLPAMGRAMERNSESTRAFKAAVTRAHPMGAGEVDIEIPQGTAFPRPSFGFIGAAMVAGLGCLLCAGGVLALAGGLPKMYYGFASQSWPTVPGEVIGNIGASALSARKSLHNTVILPPGFLYQYEVAGTKHVNSVRRFRSTPGTQDDQERANAPADLPVGTKVPVAYFLADPDISTLEPGNDGGMFILPGIGIVLLLFSFGIFFSAVPSFL